MGRPAGPATCTMAPPDGSPGPIAGNGQRPIEPEAASLQPRSARRPAPALIRSSQEPAPRA
jgi:hypothetical protein